MDAKKSKELTKNLNLEKKGLLEQISRLENTGLGKSLSDSISELSVYDNHPADISGELFERSKDLALRDNAHVLLERIENALEKIKKGTYEYCSKCGNKIPVSRLEVIPWANECVECQGEDDSLDLSRRPIEEQLLTPPFKRTFLDDDKNEFVGFDGEDALQAVLRYGSSDSPQDLPGSSDYNDLFPASDEHEGIVDPIDAIPVKENILEHNKDKNS